MIYTAPYVKVLMRADPIRGQVGGDLDQSPPTCPGIGLEELGPDTHVRYCNCGPANKKTRLNNATQAAISSANLPANLILIIAYLKVEPISISKKVKKI